MITRYRSLFVMEGPAGSGKSTMIQKLLGCFPALLRPVTPLAQMDRPRNYVGDEGLLLSQLKDYQTTLNLVGMEMGSSGLIADRWYLSQLIYGALRQGKGGPEPDKLHQGLLGAARAVHQADREYWSRYPCEVEVDARYRIHLMLLLPSLGMLTEQREGVNRDFPFKAAREQKAYGDLILRLSCLGHRINKAGLVDVEMFSSFWGFDSVRSRGAIETQITQYVGGELGWIAQRNQIAQSRSTQSTSTWNPG